MRNNALEEIENNIPNIPSETAYKYFSYKDTFDTLNEDPFKNDYIINIPGNAHGIVMIEVCYHQTRLLYHLPNYNKNSYKGSFVNFSLSNNSIIFNNRNCAVTDEVTVNLFVWYS